MKKIITRMLLLFAFGVFSQSVTQAEYFWDNDPGVGNGIALQALDGNFNQALETVFSNNATLPAIGNHTIGIRIKGQDGSWSSVFRKTFKVSGNTNNNSAVKITTAEYFWDNDPGEGAGTTMIAFDGNFNQALESVMVNNIALPTIGDHVIGIRVKGDDGNWGSTFKKVFRMATNNNSNNIVKVSTAEYFWDNDPGEGSGIVMLAFDGDFNKAIESVMSNNATLPTIGNHVISIRLKADDGSWGTLFSKVFRLSENNNTNNLVKIIQAEYFWNQDPGQGNGIVMLAFDGDFNQALESIMANNAAFPNPGLNVLRVRVKADENNWGNVYSKVVGVNITFDSKVTLVSPANNAINVPTNSNFVWNVLTGAGSYEYQCATDSSFTTLTQSGIISGTSVPFSGLSINTLYYWRVRANVNGNVSLWSDVWSFITDNNLSIVDFDNNTVVVYPNPSSHFIYLKSTTALDEFEYILYSLDGKNILKGKINQNQQINIEPLAIGTYILSLKDNNGVSKNIKLLKI
ncbi:MAG: T9SS type A sorting domain-containing protein [Bacteroidetes bacterium]|uniref:T9SS type A sorting domain-containing protein n=1 Tax=Flavobacterium sp. TaxID=239 RepID=UPI002FD9F417|nr:T9SS type A sorting domain-containing protein [Bacteroidota bacterium]